MHIHLYMMMHLCILAAGVMETNLGGEALLEIIKVRSIIWRGLSSFSVHERQQRHTSFDDCQGGKKPACNGGIYI